MRIAAKYFTFQKNCTNTNSPAKSLISESLYLSLVLESSLNVIPDVDSVSSNTSMLNDVEVATNLNTIPCSSQKLSSSDIPQAELNSSSMSTTTETHMLDLSEVPEVEPYPSILCTPSCKRQNKKAKSVQRKVFDISVRKKAHRKKAPHEGSGVGSGLC